MPFEYENSGLPANNRWKTATAICNKWLDDNMSMFGPERIANFMHNQPVAAAKRVMDTCEDWSEESVTLLLLGPAKAEIIANEQVEKVARNIFGDRTVDLMHTMADPAKAKDDAMLRDTNRIYIAEGVSTMTDQMIGRAKIDKFHETRWKILNDLERTFATIKGQDPRLDAVFEDAAKKSHEALEALDRAAAATSKKPFKPPFNPHR
ncbi:MAG: hypothetical protein GC185_08755 [Alphaproteobacteria bacterium]|nr:hypothetical protein [Alphaproteobacteria bacterium]